MNKWDLRCLNQARLIASWSRDPRRKVGCVIVDADNNTLSDGYNGFPRGIADDSRLEDKALKNKLIVHAEANAIAKAARNGHSVKGGTAYCTYATCPQCAALLIQAGISRFVWEDTFNDPQPTVETINDQILALNLLQEAKIITDRIS